MAEKSTIARPYAQAAFELATEQKDLRGWSNMLQYAAMVAIDPNMEALIGNPEVDRARLVDVFIDVCGSQLNKAGQNFVRVLGENKRLNFLPEIAALYEALRAEAEGTVEAEIITALPLSASQQQQLTNALRKRLGREIQLICKTDDSLLGGAVIRAGDLVIDGSAAGQLNKLANALLH